MKAIASIMGGVCVLGEGRERRFVDVVKMSEVPLNIAHLIYGAVDDWEAISAQESEELLSETRNRHYCARGVANIEACLKGISSELQAKLLSEVEDLLQTLAIHRQLNAMLLRAPLKSLQTLNGAIKQALALGFAAGASVLENVRESQPHLHRLADRWMSIPINDFAALPGGQTQTWRLAVQSEVVLETLEAPNFESVEKSWRKLVFKLQSPAERTAINRISKAVARALFPEHALSAQGTPNQPESNDQDEIGNRQQKDSTDKDARVGFERAQKQVEAISTAVAEGHDAKAKQYLRELVNSQLSYFGGEKFAVKSLCNLAHQCAEMFRTDFEFECLQTAIEIDASDGWTLIQLADHFKRVGRFEDAIETLRKAASSNQERILQTSLADVYAQMGRFQDAIAIYDQIPGAEADKIIRVAKADVLRRWGRLDDANREYDRLIEESMASDRVFAGKAEIAKRQGRLNEARGIYQDLINNSELDAASSIVYRLAQANVLVRIGNLSDAYKHIDDVVQKRPFARQAIAYRAAVAGLLGNASLVIGDLPNLGQTKAFNEWVNQYVRGLLLLLLNRYSEAQESLIRSVEERLLDKDATGMLQLGAAVCFLQTRPGITDAKKILSRIPEMKDAFADAIRAALQYHVAVTLRQVDDIARLELQLGSVDDTDLAALVHAIKQRNWKEACRLEVRTLLRLAA